LFEFHHAAIKLFIVLFKSGPVIFQWAFSIPLHWYDYSKKDIYLLYIMSGHLQHILLLSDMYKYWFHYSEITGEGSFISLLWITFMKKRKTLIIGVELFVQMRYLFYLQSTETSSKRLDNTRILRMLWSWSNYILVSTHISVISCHSILIKVTFTPRWTALSESVFKITSCSVAAVFPIHDNKEKICSAESSILHHLLSSVTRQVNVCVQNFWWWPTSHSHSCLLLPPPN
jgi:hypothetical protein